jgi:multicomponent Na+:H+ antiporter subunit G
MADWLNLAASFWEAVRYPIGGAFAIAGALLCIVGSIGVLRFPDFYTRLHGASITDTSGAGFVVFGMMFLAPHWLVLVKLICLLGFLLLTSSTGSHALAHAAHTAGMQPKIGPVRRGRVEHEAEADH